MILIAGGSGLLGREVVRLLVERGLKVRVLTRDSARTRNLQSDLVEIAIGDVRNPATIGAALVGVQTVVSVMSGYGPGSGGSPRTVDFEGNRHLIKAAEAAGAEHLVLVSVHGAAPDHPMELMRMKFLAEQEVKRSRMAWTVIRPALFMETWAKVVGEPLLKMGRAVILGHGENPINLVSARDVARVVEQAVIDPATRGLEIEVGGPEDVTLNEFAATFATVTARPNRRTHVPRGALRLLAVLARPVHPTIARMARDAVVMDTLDFKFDHTLSNSQFASAARTSLSEVVRREYAPGRITL